MAQTLNTYIRKRGAVSKRVKVIDKFVNEYDVNTGNILDIKNRLEVINQCYNEYQEHHLKIIEMCDDQNFQDQCDKYNEFESQVMSLKTKLQTLIHSDDKKTILVNNNDNENKVSEDMAGELRSPRLPDIALPCFDGNVSEWLRFRDTFDILIDKNKRLSQVEKFYYLMGSVKDNAKLLIQKIEFCATGYDQAWEALKKRYDNKRALIDFHVEGLFNLKGMIRESAIELRQLIDEANRHLCALQACGQPIEFWSTLIIHMIVNKLSFRTRCLWEEQVKGDELPTFEQLEEFVHSRCRVLERSEKNRKFENVKNTSSPMSSSVPVKSKSFVLQGAEQCVYCGKSHSIYKCENFIKMSVTERCEKVRELKLCYNCLKKGHLTRDCRLSSCRLCNKKHNILIHWDNNSETKNISSKTNSNNNENIPVNTDNSNRDNTQLNERPTNCCASVNNNQILLSTAIIHIRDYSGKYVEARALLDSGSQCNLISENLRKKLNIKSSTTKINVCGFGGDVAVNTKIYTEIKSRIENYSEKLEFLVLPRLTNYIPSVPINRAVLNIPIELELADPTFDVPNDIDLLLGVEIFYEILKPDKIIVTKKLPILQNSRFGWIVSGKMQIEDKTKIVSCNFGTSCELQNQVQRFWELESVETRKYLTEEERVCEKHFEETHYRQKDGRYVVRLPVKRNSIELGDSEQMAWNRFANLEKKLNTIPETKKKYIEFMSEYERLGHMRKITNQDEHSSLNYFLPHHAVEKPESSTTKLRVVFDASAKTTSGLSLNNVLMVGPTLQDDLFSIMLRFRKHQYAFTADIQQMYRQINVDERDQKLQQIIWRDPTDGEIKKYKLQTITYGTASAPYLATKVLQQLGIDESVNYPLAAEVMCDIYMDDVISGHDNINTAIEIRDQLKSMMSSANMNLRKWSANSKLILAGLLESEIEHSNDKESMSINQSIKTLGVQWNPGSDKLSIKQQLKCFDSNHLITKRTILSCVASIFDPLGLIGAVTVKYKIFLQKLWEYKLEWDTVLPKNLGDEWHEIYEQFNCINDIKINRWVMIENCESVELHVFGDASEKAYGAVAYLKCVNNCGDVRVNLLCCKTRVAPLNKTTVPRLELCAALLASRLVEKIMKSIKLNIKNVFMWSDSEIVLWWLQTSPNLLKSFVNHRIAEIQESTKDYQWRYVPSYQNPADLASRGVLTSVIKNLEMWWSGPTFLKNNILDWPVNRISEFKIKLPEMKEIKTVMLSSVKSEFVKEFSNLGKLQRVVAYILRFIKNSKLKEVKNRSCGNLTTEEIDNAIMCIIKMVQCECFFKELNELQESCEVDKYSKIRSLNPIIDKRDNIIRVGGRLKHSTLEIAQKHPILLPSSHHFTKILIRQIHVEEGHIGQQGLLSAVRRKFWPLRAKDTIKQVIKECIICFKVNPSVVEQYMGDLPAKRVTALYPFMCSGVDYAGPLLLREGGPRSKKVIKVYIAIFVCFATKAIHIELISDLSSSAFIAALHRFVSRRGLCSDLYSDNATCFIGANSELKELYKFVLEPNVQNQINEACVRQGINWHFIPARSPQFGGLWEAAVKSMKFHLRRIVGLEILSYEELLTVLIKIEAILNSRPLFPESDDPNDLRAITPGHFIIGRPLRAVVEANVEDVKLNRLNRWNLLQRLSQNFWRRWSSDYLHNLQQRNKAYKSKITVEVGRLVIVRDENLPPLKWVRDHNRLIGPAQTPNKNSTTKSTTNSLKSSPSHNNNSSSNVATSKLQQLASVQNQTTTLIQRKNGVVDIANNTTVTTQQKQIRGSENDIKRLNNNNNSSNINNNNSLKTNHNLNRISEIELNLTNANKVNEALGVVIQHLAFNLDAFSCPSLKLRNAETDKNFIETKFLLDDSRATCQSLELKLADNETLFATREAELQEAHRCEILNAENCLAEIERTKQDRISFLESELIKKSAIEDTLQSVIQKTNSELELQENLAKERENELLKRISELSVTENELREKVVASENDFGERLRLASVREKDLTEKLNQLNRQIIDLKTKAELKERELDEKLCLSLDEICILRNNHHSNRSSNSDDPHDSSVSPSRLSSSLTNNDSSLLDEVNSLRCVLELKQREVSDLRKQTQEYQRDAERLPPSLFKIAALESRVEDLQSQLAAKFEQEKELQQKAKQAQDAHAQEVKRCNRLTLRNEELVYRLKQNSEKYSHVLNEFSKSYQDQTFHSCNSKSLISDLETTPVMSHESKSNGNFDRNDDVFVTDDISPPSSPVVKGVIERGDSVSYVLEIDDEKPELAALRLVRRAGSFRSGLNEKQHSQQYPIPKRQKYQLNPLTQSASATILTQISETTSAKHSKNLNNFKYNGSNGKTETLDPKKIVRSNSQNASNIQNQTVGSTLSYLKRGDKPTTSTPIRNRAASFSCDEQFSEFNTKFLQKRITCNTAALTTERDELCPTLPSLPSVQDFKNLQNNHPKESAGEAMVSGSNSEDEASSLGGSTPMEVSWSEDGEQYNSESIV